MNMNARDEYLRKSRLKKIKRTRQLRFRFFLSALFIAIIITFVFGAFKINAKASTKDDIHYYKYFKSITVSKDDTLWTLAKENSVSDDYEAYIKEVMHMNHIDEEEDIKTGMNLVIPYYSFDFVE